VLGEQTAVIQDAMANDGGFIDIHPEVMKMLKNKKTTPSSFMKKNAASHGYERRGNSLGIDTLIQISSFIKKRRLHSLRFASANGFISGPLPSQPGLPL
jgi:hypothetical protein